MAYADLYVFNADPQFAEIPLAKLISKSYAAERCRKIDPRKASVPPPVHEPAGGTVYLSTADRWGNMVSFIFSIYRGFGSGITVPGYGFVLNNRGALFSLDPRSPNCIAPGKRPFHTLLPGFVMKNGRPLMSFGLMGAAQQAQGHVQVLIDLLDLGANVQAASDAARFHHDQATNILQLESSLYDSVGPALRELGHHAVSATARAWADTRPLHSSTASIGVDRIIAKMAKPLAGETLLRKSCLVAAAIAVLGARARLRVGRPRP